MLFALSLPASGVIGILHHSDKFSSFSQVRAQYKWVIVRCGTSEQEVLCFLRMLQARAMSVGS